MGISPYGAIFTDPALSEQTALQHLHQIDPPKTVCVEVAEPKEVTDQALSALLTYLASKTIKQFQWKNCRFSDAAWGHLMFILSHVNALSKLQFTGCALTERHLRPLNAVLATHARTLTRFALSQNPLQPFPWNTLTALDDCTALLSLNMAGNQFESGDIKALRESLGSRSIESLDLSDNPLKEPGVRQVVRIVEKSPLVKFKLNRCQVDDAGVDYLTLALQSRYNFLKCELAGNLFTQKGLSHIIRRVDQINYLDVSGNLAIVQSLKVLKYFLRVNSIPITVRMGDMPVVTEEQIHATVQKWPDHCLKRRATLLVSERFTDKGWFPYLQEVYQNTHVKFACIETYKKEQPAKRQRGENASQTFQDRINAVEIGVSAPDFQVMGNEVLPSLIGSEVISIRAEETQTPPTPPKKRRELTPHESTVLPFLNAAEKPNSELLKLVLEAPTEMERDFLFFQFLGIQFSCKSMKADGLCLYYSLQYAEPDIFQTVEQTLGLLADQMVASWEMFAPFLVDEQFKGTPEDKVKKFCEGLKRGDHWGDQVAIQAAILVLQMCGIQRPIWVYDVSAPGDFNSQGWLLPPLHQRFGEGENPIILHRSHFLPESDEKMEHYCVLVSAPKDKNKLTLN